MERAYFINRCSKFKLMKIPRVQKLLKKAFNGEKLFAISLFAILSRSLSFTWIFWDALLSNVLYKKQKFYPDHLLRFMRLGIGISWFIGFVTPFTAGVFLIGDGLYSIIRYRSLKITKNFIEDVPRLARIGIGLVLLPVVLI